MRRTVRFLKDCGHDISYLPKVESLYQRTVARVKSGLICLKMVLQYIVVMALEKMVVKVHMGYRKQYR